MPDARMAELQSAAVAALEEGEAVLRAADLSDHEEDGWSADFAELLADGMAACRWFVWMGFKTPGSFGGWLTRITMDRISPSLSHKALDDAVDRASSSLRALDQRWAERTNDPGEQSSS